MARNLTAPSFQLSPLKFQKHPRTLPKFAPLPNPFAPLTASSLELRRCRVSAQQKAEMETVSCEETKGEKWGKVSSVLFDMDGVLCNSEELSRLAAVDVFADLGVAVTTQDFVPFMGTGEANFLGGVAKVKGVKDLTTDDLKKRFFDIYLTKYAKPNSGIGFPGALELIKECKETGLKVAVASSADRIKVDANLSAAGLPLSLFDAIVSADAFENLKPAPDIFLAASKILDVDPSECLVIEDALAGVQAANAAQMRCIAVTTTLSEEALGQAKPTIVRKEIGDISISDILHGGSFPLSEIGAEVKLKNKRKGKKENRALKEVFGLMDRDGDGEVGFDDLKETLEMMGMEVGDKKVTAMIKAAGGQLDGGVRFEALAELLSG